MSKNIDRTLFWFKDGAEKLDSLNNRFFCYSALLNRLLNEKYGGKKIKFINLYFYTEATYELFPQIEKGKVHYYGGHLSIYNVLDLIQFGKVSYSEQTKLIWGLANDSLKKASEFIKNASFQESCNYAFEKGIEINLNPDFPLIEADGLLYEEGVKATLWINFEDNRMYSNLTLEKNGLLLFRKFIDESKNSNEFFLEMYKKIEFNKNAIVIKGDRDVEYLPLKINLDKDFTIRGILPNPSKCRNNIV
jgi:hypothetical protein